MDTYEIEVDPRGGSGASPFESIRYEDAEGNSFWYARELSGLMGYDRWRHFNGVIGRARTAMVDDGVYDPKDHFRLVKRPARVSVDNPTQTSDQGGRPSVDYRLTKEACYFVAINGDPKKKPVALAQQYFVIQTMRMEAVEEALSSPPPPPMGMPSHIEALRGWANALEAQERAEEAARRAQAEAEELRPPAEAWRALAAAGGDCSIAEAAAVLNRAEGITTGPQRLTRWLQEIKVVYRRSNGQLVPYSGHQAHVRLRPMESGRIELRLTPAALEWIMPRLRQEQNRPQVTAGAPRVAIAPKS
jgi:phage antirepressor YoqD-like protein